MHRSVENVMVLKAALDGLRPGTEADAVHSIETGKLVKGHDIQMSNSINRHILPPWTMLAIFANVLLTKNCLLVMSSSEVLFAPETATLLQQPCHHRSCLILVRRIGPRRRSVVRRSLVFLIGRSGSAHGGKANAFAKILEPSRPFLFDHD